MLRHGGSDHEDGSTLVGTRVLVVEDEFLLADLICETLSDNGAEIVGPVGTLEEALATIESEAFDIAVLDVNLRGRSVYPLAAALHKRDTPFLFVSGYKNLNDLQAHFPDAPTLEKPTDLGVLQQAVMTLLGSRVSP